MPKRALLSWACAITSLLAGIVCTPPAWRPPDARAAQTVPSIPASPLAWVGAPPLQSRQPGCRSFPETGKRVCGRLLSYWTEHGGLAQNGYPISAQFTERSEVDGKLYSVQYFERAVFELHPENKPPYDVLLSLLGSISFKQKYPAGATNQAANRSPGSVVFPETGRRLGGAFLDYWKTHGGLAQQGYPISDEFRERSDLDGRRYVVQYFERAVFELHLENSPPYNVLLSQLGTMQMKRRYPGGVQARALPPGSWGGDQISLQVTGTGGTVEFSCAHGTLDQPITLDPAGRFDVPGAYVPESSVRPLGILDFGFWVSDYPRYSNPKSKIQNPKSEEAQPARYSGQTDGATMTLTVTLTTSNRRVGTYTLTYGKTPRLIKCMSSPP